jgi:hypothetical protein
MSQTLIIIAAVVLALHGLIHLMGTVVSLQWAHIEGLHYTTTLLGGCWDVGEGGIRVFGVLWAVAAVGCVIVAVLVGWGWWQPVLVGVILFSLVLTSLDWSNAFAGALMNSIILALLWLGPRMAHWFSWETRTRACS